MIDSLLHVLATSNLPLTDEEFADILWLASYMDMSSSASTLASAPQVKSLAATPADAQNPPQQPTKDQQAASTSGQPTASAQAEVHLPKSSTHDKQRIEGMRSLSFRSPAATALPGKLALARALRPILRKIPSSTQLELDEVATAEQAAEEGRITPQLRPGRERWLDVAVVIDDWHTMAIWQQTIAEFIELLQQLGAFRTLQTYLLSTKDDEQTEQATLQLFTAQGFERGRICPSGELVDPRGRRLTLVLTDCTSPIWSNGAAGNLLSQWGNRNMVTLVQMLPADLWNSCALADAIQIAVSAPAPGSHNAKLAVERPWYWDDIWDEERTPAMLSQPFPIITLEPEPLRRWTQVMAGKGGSKATAFYLSLQPVRLSNQKTQILSESLSPEERWRHFRANASPMAQELAGYLSAAPLSLQVMHLIQRVMLPQSRQVHLAEILRSGLIERMTPSDTMLAPDEIRYEFTDGVRKLLLTTVLLSDSKQVLEKVSDYVNKRNEQLSKFHTLILDPTSSGDFSIDEKSLPLANVAAIVLRRLGGQYTQLAGRLERLIYDYKTPSTLRVDVWGDDLLAPRSDTYAFLSGFTDNVVDITAWREVVKIHLESRRHLLRQIAPNTLYGFLAASTLAPFLAAVNQGDFGVLSVLMSVVGGVGGNLIANYLQTWKDRTEAELPIELTAKAEVNPEWREALDRLLLEFDVPRLVQETVEESDQEWFIDALRRELARIGSSITVESNVVSGDKIKVSNSTASTGMAIGKSITQIITNYYEQTDAKADAERQEMMFRTYLKGVIAETGTLDLSGVDRATASNPEAAKLELAAIYTALDTQAMEAGQRQSALAFANKTRYAALLGDPGSGKTTFINFLALCLAGELLENGTANLARLGDEWQVGTLLPLRVVLHNFAAQLPAKPVLDSQNASDLLWQYITRRLGESLQEFVPLLKWQLLESGGLLMLDGLDEVPEAQERRDWVKAAVIGIRRQFPKVRILLTSRTYAYQRQQWRLPDFAEAVLAPFDQEQITAFVDNWYIHMAQVRPNLTLAEAQGRAALLNQIIERNRYLRELAVRPLLLTLMASLHAWRGGALPDHREQLYAESVELLLDIWERPKIMLDDEGKPVIQSESMAEWLRVPQRQLMAALEKLAYTVHAAQTSLTGTADIEEGQLVSVLIAAADNSDLRPARVVEYLRDHAGLLISRSEHIYSFPHRTFQEYLAARHLTENRFPNELVRLVRSEPERWSEVLLLAGIKVARGTPFAAWNLVAGLCPRVCDPAQAKEPDWWTALLAGQLLVETHIYAQINPQVDLQESDTLERVRDWLAQLVSQGRLPPVDRAAAGVALGRLGDPRPGVGVKNGLPEIIWCTVDAGPFIMGSDKRKDKAASDEEAPQFTCNLIQQPYRISRYLITVAQYHCFVKAKGYEQSQWWTEAGWQWLQRNNIIGPRAFGDVFETPNHPQVGVSWYEAVAFCRWLAEQNGFVVCLPSEAEWERAARHIDGRLYPWGDEFDASYTNTGEAGISNTSSVGIFPNANAVSGAAEMSGNVREWCNTKWLPNYDGYEQQVDDDLAGDALRVLRGSSFIDYQLRGGIRCAFRLGGSPLGPDYRQPFVGFRVVALR